MTIEDDHRYQAYYCEENVWFLCRDASASRDDFHVVVISNEAQACALWNQRASSSTDQPVVWDYHVVGLETGGAPRIWDLDTELGCPLPADEWWSGTFPHGRGLPERYLPRFRVVAADVYLEYFSSDRRHMRREDGWHADPPPWEPIFDAELGMTLSALVDMADDEAPGEVYSMQAFEAAYVSPD